MASTQYIVVSPVRNEEDYLPRAIESMVAQTLRPAEWIIVDDGSTDQTHLISQRAATQHGWIRPIRRADRGFRQAGGGVMQAFYDGFASSKTPDWRFLVKLDGDLSFAPDYFAQCLARFDASPKLGIAGGTICNVVNGKLQVESVIDPAFHVRGATKIYRRECWDQIAGLIRAPGWDTLDEIKANMLGWTTRTIPELPLTHHRPAGAAYGQWNNLLKNGQANYVVGYHPLFMLLKCLSRAFQRPYLLQGWGLWCGYLGGYFKRVPRVADKEVLRYFRRQQMNRLLGRTSLWS